MCWGGTDVGFMVSEIYIANPGGCVCQFIGVDRVEVRNGPQGTLFGRNTTGGVVHFITKRPSKEFEAEAYFETGWYDSLKFSSVPVIKAGVAVHVPLGETLSAGFATTPVRHENNTLTTARLTPEPNQERKRLA